MKSATLFKHICLAICHVGAIVMCSVLVYRYFRNEDASKIQYHSFHHTPDDLYPTLTLCLNARTGGLLLEKEIAKLPNGTEPFQLLIGNKTATSENEYNSINFESMMLTMHQFLKKFYAKNEYSEKIDPWYHPEIYPNGYKTFSKFEYEDLKFYTSYLDPTTICFSWNVQYSHEDVLRNADVYIHIDKLQTISQGKLTCPF